MLRRGFAGLAGATVLSILGAVLALGNLNVNAQDAELGAGKKSSAGSSMQGEQEVQLGTGRRKAVKVDYTRVKFPHKEHQERLLKKFNGDKEQACKFCHHTKKEGQDPRACRRCHAGRLRKSKGGEDRPEFVKRKTRAGKLLKLKDIFHIQCKGCHENERENNLDLQSHPDRAPVENCEGCHVAVGAAKEGTEVKE